MKCYLTILFFTLGLNNVFGQNEDWKLYQSVDGVEIHTTVSDCQAKNIPAQVAVLLKLVNTTNFHVKIEWDLHVWYNDEEVIHNIEDGENHYSVELEPGASIKGDCETPYGALYIFKDFITYQSKTKMTKFELRNIKVTLS